MKKSFLFLLSSSFFLFVVLLTGCGGSKPPAVDPQKMQLALKDTLYYQRGVSPEAGAERLQMLLKEYTDLVSWEKRKKAKR